MPAITLASLPDRQLFPGYIAKLVHTERMTLSFLHVEPGHVLPAHSHDHEQITVVIEGELELTVGGETVRLTPGMVMPIPSNVPHTGQAITPCYVLDVFAPVREDYR
jgi:quercetin dioxygenase-like cupin family protein